MYCCRSDGSAGHVYNLTTYPKTPSIQKACVVNPLLHPELLSTTAKGLGKADAKFNATVRHITPHHAAGQAPVHLLARLSGGTPPCSAGTGAAWVHKAHPRPKPATFRIEDAELGVMGGMRLLVFYTNPQLPAPKGSKWSSDAAEGCQGLWGTWETPPLPPKHDRSVSLPSRMRKVKLAGLRARNPSTPSQLKHTSKPSPSRGAWWAWCGGIGGSALSSLCGRKKVTLALRVSCTA